MNEDRSFDLLINLGTYKPKYFLSRIIIVSSIAVLLIFIVGLITGVEVVAQSDRKIAYLFSVIAFNSITEVNIFLLQLMAKSKNRWNIFLQLLIIFMVIFVIASIVILIARKVFGQINIFEHERTQIILIIGLLLIIIHLLVIVISNLTKEWVDRKREISELKQAKLLSDYNSIKDRLNPHFLFNNLSVLKSLIHYNPKDAEVFIQNFTNVYRYVLKSHEETTVPLEEELKFLNSYVALHKERIGEGLIVEINIENTLLQKAIPPMTLQLLIENAIKHNIANKLHPLRIDIYSHDTYLVVKNNLNRKESPYSANSGLKTLKSQYKLLANKQIKITDNNELFIIELPLL